MQFVLSLILVFFAVGVVAQEPKRIPLFDPFPIHQKPIDYWSADSQDPIARLGRRITHEGLNLNFSDRFGYLPTILQELEIPLSSQLLRSHRGGLSGLSISSKQPLAIYFDDAVVVRSRLAPGMIQNAEVFSLRHGDDQLVPVSV